MTTEFFGSVRIRSAKFACGSEESEALFDKAMYIMIVMVER
jgi:hypothetical protein